MSLWVAYEFRDRLAVSIVCTHLMIRCSLWSSHYYKIVFSTLYVSIDFKEIGICRIISPFAWRWFGVRFYNFFRTIATHFQLNSSSTELYYSAYKFNETNFNGFITNAAAPQSYLSLINKKKYLPIAITFDSTILVDWWAFLMLTIVRKYRK